MKSRFPIAMLLLVAALATSVCSKSEPDVGQLEELPKDIADNLKRVPDSDVLISIAPVAAPSPLTAPSKPNGPIFARACSETQNFLVQVIYPVTVCSRRDLVASAFLAAAPPRSSGPVATATVKSYKLTGFEDKILPSPFLCQTRNGPWLATIVRNIQCNEATSCVMVIMGVPSCPACPAFLWSGPNCQVSNRPTQVQFIDPVVEQGPPGLAPCSTKTNCGGSTTTPSPIHPTD
jgi:hypothetical protein